ncbi:MAG: hypothetical protein WBQ75_01885 [Acetobacteraceae bacterium]
MRRIVLAAMAVALGGAGPATMGPDQETWLAGIVDQFSAAHEAAPNDMAKGLVRHQRATSLCGGTSAVKRDKGTVTDWEGTVETLDSTNDGRGILTLRIAPHVTLGTTNNALSEMVGPEKTLIALDTPLYRAAVALRIGQKVRFSGHFFPSKDDCLKEMSLTPAGGMTDPDFLFAFTALTPAD